MSAVNTVATMNGYFKQVYGDKVIPLVPSVAVISKRVPFLKREQIGDAFNQPVDLSTENGFTNYLTSNEGSTTLIAANAGQMKNASIDGSNKVGRSRLGYAALMKASTAGSAKAFGEASAWIVKRIAAAAVKRHEIELLWGQKGIGAIASVSGSSTTRAWVISDASWAAGIWAGTVGATLDVFDPGLAGSKLNTDAAVTIVSVDVTNKTLNVSGDADDLTAIEALDVIFWETCSPTTEFAGIEKILSNSGSLFGIDAAVYELWAGNTYSANTGTASMAVINAGAAMTASFGNTKDLACFVSPTTFEVLNSDLAAQKMNDSSYSTEVAENGSKTLKFYGQTGMIEIIPNLYEKDGFMHMLPLEEFHRIGASDISFVKRHGDSESLILENADSPSAEMRIQSNLACYMEAPRHGVRFAGVTN